MFAISVIVFAFSRLALAVAIDELHGGLRHDGPHGRQQHDRANGRRRRQALAGDGLLHDDGARHDTDRQSVCFGTCRPAEPHSADGWRLVGAGYTVAIGGAISLVGAMLFMVRLPALRKAARPMLERAGVLPQIATGLESTEIADRARG